MSAVGDVVAAIRDALTSAGVPTADGPTTVAPLVAAAGVAALIQPPEVSYRVVGKPMATTTDVYLLGAPPGDTTQLEPLWELLPAALDALHAGEARLTTRDVGGVLLPGYLIRTTNRAT